MRWWWWGPLCTRPTHLVGFLCLRWEVIDSFCWYWWNVLSSLFKTSSLQCLFIGEIGSKDYYSYIRNVVETRKSNNCWPVHDDYHQTFWEMTIVSDWLIDWFIYCVWRHFQQYFGYIMATSFSGVRNRSTRGEPPTMGKQLVNFITFGCELNAPFL
jgi:hypothetical protein